MKNIFLITFIFFIYGCGYSSVYKNLKTQSFQIVINDMQGDIEMNNLIKNEMNLYSNKNSSNRFEVDIDTTYKRLVIAKNITGVVTDYKLSVDSKFTISFNENSKIITVNEILNIKNKSDNFEQSLYEKSIKRNFASAIREKLITEIINYK